MNNAALVREFLDWQMSTRGRTAVTGYNYASTLHQYLDWIGQVALGDVSLGMLESFVKRPRRGGRVGVPATQNKDAAILRSMYSYLRARELIESNPAAVLVAPKVNNANPRPIPDDGWNALWHVADSGNERVMLALGGLAGLRRRELCELRVDQVMLQGERLVSFKRKGGGDDVLNYGDLVQIVEEGLPSVNVTGVTKEIARHTRDRRGHEYLLSWGEEVPAPARERAVHALPEGMTDPNLLNRRMRSLCDRAGVGPYTPHQLRHTFVTNLLRCDVPLHLVSRQANHSNPQITARYMKAGGSELREWMRKNGR